MIPTPIVDATVSDPAFVVAGTPIVSASVARQLERDRARLIEALEKIRTHHVAINEQIGRPVEHSRTIGLCNAALSSLEAKQP